MKQKQLFKYIKGTAPKAIVPDRTVLICHLSHAVMKGGDFTSQKVYINTRVLKHLYDKKPAEEFHFMLDNLHVVIKHPNKIYKNKDGKRGDYCLLKSIGSEKYICSLEVVKADGEEEKLMIATAFRVRKDSYLNSYELLWSWRDDIPSS